MTTKMSVVFDVGGVLLDWQPERYLAQTLPDEDCDALAAVTFRSDIWRALDAGRVTKADVARAFVATTNLAPARVESLLDEMPASLAPIVALPNVFRGRVFSYAELTLKPEASIYRVLQERCQLNAAQCVFIDDTLANLEAAAEQGMHTVHMPDASAATAATVIAQVSALL
ncbi:MAG: HAD-IA family hydrolase [Pseudomonadales bacterium]